MVELYIKYILDNKKCYNFYKLKDFFQCFFSYNRKLIYFRDFIKTLFLKYNYYYIRYDFLRME